MAARTGHGQRGLGVGAVLLLIAAGCTGDGSGDATATTAATPSPSPVDLVTDDPHYPAEAQEYAELTVAAWAAPDLYRLGELATNNVQQELLELPGPPQRGWRLIDCAPDEPAATTECAFYNLDGDQLWLTVEAEQLGDAQAVTGGGFDPIAFPDEPLAYVAAYVEAWQAGNQARMQALGADAVATTFGDLPPVGDPSYRLAESTNAFTTVVIDFDPAATDDEADRSPGSDPSPGPDRSPDADPTPVVVTVSVNPSLLGEAAALRAAEPDRT
ncbi:hypothetical protein JQS43_04290 [Natronosporangium hydrolyticum]|uniref:Uncharacterized protein n=1 Tax=Natronosporangium hydrolyticum TaxID=2811111 RepID=A0A895YCR2_9ACTN|nr:hypothetical protein [Natronosporangium hydrolyticum]QSB15577.1 hypothetical protein JQS43_04290 [Natronosporangium hydrolyticum]